MLIQLSQPVGFVAGIGESRVASFIVLGCESLMIKLHFCKTVCLL